jgi:hypothetical protein
MNERIRELAEQNGFIHNWQPPGEQYDKLQTLEKFAELIIQECIGKKEWVGLTDEEIAQGLKESWVTEQAWQSAVWWAEAKLREKNT